MGPGVVLALLLAAPLGAVANLGARRLGPQSPRVERLARRLVDDPAQAYAGAALVAAAVAVAGVALLAVIALMHLAVVRGDEAWTEWRFDTLLRVLAALVGLVLLVTGWLAATFRRAAVRAEDLRFGRRYADQ